MSLGYSGEHLGVEELIPDPSVERLGIAVLLRCSWLDAGRGSAAVLAPALQVVGDECGPVVAASERWRRVQAVELFQYRHHVIGLAASAHPDSCAEAAALIDHVEELQSAAIGCGI